MYPMKPRLWLYLRDYFTVSKQKVWSGCALYLFCAPCVLVTLRYGAGIIFLVVRRFARIAALTRFSHFRQHPKWQLPMRAARTITIQSARNSLSVSLVSVTQQLSLAQNNAAPAARCWIDNEAAVALSSPTAPTSQTRNYFYLPSLSSALSDMYKFTKSVCARSQAKSESRDSFGQIGAQGVVNQLFGIQSAARARESWARRCATGPRHTHMFFALSTVHALFDDQRRPGLVLMSVTSSDDAPSPLLFILK